MENGTLVSHADVLPMLASCADALLVFDVYAHGLEKNTAQIKNMKLESAAHSPNQKYP